MSYMHIYDLPQRSSQTDWNGLSLCTPKRNNCQLLTKRLSSIVCFCFDRWKSLSTVAKERSRVARLVDFSDCHKSPQFWSTKGCQIKLCSNIHMLDYSDVPSGGQAKRMAIIYNLMAARKFWNSRQNILIYSGHPLVDTGDSLGRALALHRSLFPTAVSSDSRNLVKIPSLRARPHLWKQTQGFWGRGWGIRLKPQMVEAQRKLRPSVSWDNIWGGGRAVLQWGRNMAK